MPPKTGLVQNCGLAFFRVRASSGYTQSSLERPLTTTHRLSLVRTFYRCCVSAPPVLRWLLLAGTVLLTTAMSAHAQSVASEEALTAEQAQKDVRILKRALQELHPALTKYQSQAQMDAAFARFELRGAAARTASEMFLAATELAAAIRCGHTWTNLLNQSGPAKRALLDAKNKLPLTLALVQSRFLVLASATAGIKAGDEVLQLDGATPTAIAARLFPYLRADGSSDGKRLLQLSHGRGDYSMMDIVWPLLSPPREGQYRLQVRHHDGTSSLVTVPATTLAARSAALAAQGIKPPSEAWSFRIANNIGYLTLPTFALWRDPFDWEKFLQAAFSTMAAQKTPNLVIDIRANEGGDGAIGTQLLSYLIKAPFRYSSCQCISVYERVPYILAKYLDTWDYSFFDRTGQVEKIGEKRYRFKPRVFGERVILPASMPYQGQTYLLVGAENSSAAFMLAAFAQRSGAAILVGQQTGGNLRGLNGGELTWVTLPSSGVAVDIPLLTTENKGDEPDQSVLPDVAVTQTFNARQQGQDEELAEVLRQIAAAARRSEQSHR